MDNECCICLEILEKNIAILSCKHKYHYKCIQDWVKKTGNIGRVCVICENNTEIINIENAAIYSPISTSINIVRCCNIL
jgi:hypothetical protein